MTRLAPAALLLVCLAARLAAETRTAVPGTHGGTATFVADDHGRITRIENSDGTIDSYDLTPDGTDVGVTIHISSTLSLHVRYDDADAMIAAEGLPVLRVARAGDGRTTAVTEECGRELARFAYASSGHLTRISVDGRFALELSVPDANGLVVETLSTAAGKVLRKAAVDGRTGRPALASMLDAVAVEAGLGDDWAETLTAVQSASDHLTTLTRAGGSVALYLVNAGRFTVGFTPDGAAIFYDTQVELGGSAIPSGADTVADPSTDLLAVAPNHVVITRSGTMGVWTEQPSDGAIRSAWADRGAAGRPHVRYAFR